MLRQGNILGVRETHQLMRRESGKRSITAKLKESGDCGTEKAEIPINPNSGK